MPAKTVTKSPSSRRPAGGSSQLHLHHLTTSVENLVQSMEARTTQDATEKKEMWRAIADGNKETTDLLKDAVKSFDHRMELQATSLQDAVKSFDHRMATLASAHQDAMTKQSADTKGYIREVMDVITTRDAKTDASHLALGNGIANMHTKLQDQILAVKDKSSITWSSVVTTVGMVVLLVSAGAGIGHIQLQSVKEHMASKQEALDANALRLEHERQLLCARVKSNEEAISYERGWREALRSKGL